MLQQPSGNNVCGMSMVKGFQNRGLSRACGALKKTKLNFTADSTIKT